jgi:hypothetical protein
MRIRFVAFSLVLAACLLGASYTGTAGSVATSSEAPPQAEDQSLAGADPASTLDATVSPTLDATVSSQEASVDATLMDALARWWPSAARQIPATHGGRGRESALDDCHSGKVNFPVTHGWCYVSELKLFYNIDDTDLLDPRTGQLLHYDPVQHKLLVVDAEVDELPAPRVLPRQSASAPETVSMQCTAQQKLDIQQHVQGLRADAARTDSPAMQGFFTNEAQWWEQLCPAP